MKIRDICDRINEMPTMLAIIRINGTLRVIVSYASYDAMRDEGTLTFYHGDLERVEGVDALPNGYDTFHEWVSKVAYKGNVADVKEIFPYLTEHDLAGPEYMPSWCADAWIRRQKLMIRRGEVRGRMAEHLRKRIVSLQTLIKEREEMGRKNGKIIESLARELGW